MSEKPQIVVRYEVIQEAVYNQIDGSLKEAVDTSAGDVAMGDDQEKARIIAAFNNGMGELQLNDTHSTVMMSAQNGVSSRIQSSMVEHAIAIGKLSKVRPEQQISSGGYTVSQPELLEVRFDNMDLLGWAKMALHYLVIKPKRADWVAPPTVATQIPNDATIAVFSDWGSGLYGAPAIRDEVNAMDPCSAVIHLGDTYYAGSPNEVADRLIACWPTAAGKGNAIHRTLNGNHEMYSGATAYFNAIATAPFAGQNSSCFAMQNDNWLLLGLDTSFTYGDKHGDVSPEQVAWIECMLDGSGNRKVLFFSHHQIYSQFDNLGVILQGQLGHILTDGRIYGWYFGHEHRLVIFDAHPNWGVKARCLGHGGFPEFRNSLPGSAPDLKQWITVNKGSGVPSAKVWDGPNEFIHDDADDPQKYIPHGYLVLQFDGTTVRETYRDPGGIVVRETIAL